MPFGGAAISLAQRGISLGAAISDLIRLGLERRTVASPAPGRFPVFSTRPGARPITNELVKKALEDDA